MIGRKQSILRGERRNARMGVIPLERGDPQSFDVLGHSVSQCLDTTQRPGFESWFHS